MLQERSSKSSFLCIFPTPTPKFSSRVIEAWGAGHLAAYEPGGHDGPIAYDRSTSDGTPRKLVDTSWMDALGWTTQTPLREGIARTYDWYRAHEDDLVAA